MSTKEILFTGLSTFNAIFGLATIENIASIILLCFQIFLLVVSLAFKIYRALKDKKLTEEEIKDINETIEDTKETIEDFKGGKESE